MSGLWQVMVDGHKDLVDFRFSSSTGDATDPWGPETGISICILCKGIDRQLSHLTTILGCISPLLSDVVHLTIGAKWFIFEFERVAEPEDLDNVVWLQLLRTFSSVQTLFVSENASYVIAEALKCVDWEMISEVLPALDLLRLEELHVSHIQTFMAEHLYEDHPVTFVNTKKGF